ncbi:MAG: 30S ribosomal protein S3ae [Candidatus Aenigmatarchaeota archaeon]
MPKAKKVKVWLKLISPEFLGKRELGEIPANEPEAAVGRRVILSAIDVLNDFNKYYLKFHFKIGRVDNQNAYLYFDGLECTRDYIARMIRRRVDRTDLIVDLETKDGIKLRIKTITVTRKIPSSIRTKIRKKILEILSEEIKKSTMEEFILKVLSDDFKNSIASQIKKIYPLRNFEFRKIEVKTPLEALLKKEKEKQKEEVKTQ